MLNGFNKIKVFFFFCRICSMNDETGQRSWNWTSSFSCTFFTGHQCVVLHLTLSSKSYITPRTICGGWWWVSIQLYHNYGLIWSFSSLSLSEHSYEGQPLGREDIEARECALSAGNLPAEAADRLRGPFLPSCPRPSKPHSGDPEGLQPTSPGGQIGSLNWLESTLYNVFK